jgi:hypothetical protein
MHFAKRRTIRGHTPCSMHPLHRTHPALIAGAWRERNIRIGIAEAPKVQIDDKKMNTSWVSHLNALQGLEKHAKKRFCILDTVFAISM